MCLCHSVVEQCYQIHELDPKRMPLHTVVLKLEREGYVFVLFKRLLNFLIDLNLLDCLARQIQKQGANFRSSISEKAKKSSLS